MTDVIREILLIVIQAVVAIAGTLVLRYVIPALVLKLKEWGIMKFVKAAEKKYGGGGTGIVKRSYVIEMAAKFLPKMDATLRDALIEACCEQLDLAWAAVVKEAEKE